ncbi:DUF2627 domain-containing protein [Virgibacillus halophilus]|uniref:DUF2627 domain-containing protein n=1 Tax=Tigheibacillus halophilus TaxID=361280 RepID=UPI003638EF4B
MARIIAFLILLLPGVFSAIGIKLIRDALFNDYYLLFFNAGIQFIIGCILFIGGLAFIGGFIFYRDRKMHQIRKKEKRYNQNRSHTTNR